MSTENNSIYRFLSEKPSLKIFTSLGEVVEFSPYYTTQNEAIAGELRKLSNIYEVDVLEGATVLPLPSKMILRDEGGRAKTAAPIEPDDITTKKYVDDGLFEKSEREHVHAKDDVIGLDKLDKTVLSVNNVTPDSEGNVSLGYGGVKSINNIFPNGEGDIMLPTATETDKGIVRFATSEELANGESDETAVTPMKMAAITNTLMQYLVEYAYSVPAYSQIEFEIPPEYAPDGPTSVKGILIQKEVQTSESDDYMLYRRFVGYTEADGRVRRVLLTPSRVPMVYNSPGVYKFTSPGVKHRFLSHVNRPEWVFQIDYVDRHETGDYDIGINQPTMQPISIEFEVASYAPKTVILTGNDDSGI